MPLKVAFQMDPIGSVNISADSTFRIALEAQARGHALFYYTPDKLAFVEGLVVARGQSIELRRELGNHVSCGPEIEVDLAGSMLSGCGRTRLSTWATSRQRIFWT